jgi:hypothetical protein
LSLAQDAPGDVKQPLHRAQPQPTVAGGRHSGDPIGAQFMQVPTRAKLAVSSRAAATAYAYA